MEHSQAIPVGVNIAAREVAASRKRMCPRCGYDLSGAADGWRETCPLRGTCSECGLGFDWGRMFGPEGLAPRWSFEHGERTWGRLLGTVWRGVLPWMLWRGVPIECPVRRGRLLLLVLALVPVVHVICSVAVLALDPPSGSTRVAVKPEQFLAENMEAFLVPGLMSVHRVPLALPLFVIAISMVMMPTATLLLGETLRRARVRAVHLARGYCWSWISATSMAVVMLGGAIVVSVMVRRGSIASGDSALAAYMLVAAVYPVWLWAWWYGFARLYLRLQHPFWAMTMLWVVTMLGAAAVTWGATALVAGVLG